MRHLGHSSLCIVHRALCIASIALAAFGAANAGFTPNTVIYVKADATGAANGSSWTDAYPKISPAIAAAANGDTIYVAKGVYVETLTLPKSLTLYGGFPGLSMAETPADRDPETCQTVVTPSTAAQTSAVSGAAVSSGTNFRRR